jgi:hypothetical protein
MSMQVGVHMRFSTHKVGVVRPGDDREEHGGCYGGR